MIVELRPDWVISYQLSVTGPCQSVVVGVRPCKSDRSDQSVPQCRMQNEEFRVNCPCTRQIENENENDNETTNAHTPIPFPASPRLRVSVSLHQCISALDAED